MLISWNTTSRCNLFCRHCYREAGPGADASGELSTREGRDLIAAVARAGFRLLILSGGEPLLREDILDLVAAAREAGLVPAMGTNGTLLTADIARALASAGLRGVAVSVDSLDRDYHDDFRGMKGAYDLTQRGIANALASGLRVQINLTLTDRNLDQFDTMVDHYEALGVQAVHPFFLVPTGRALSMADGELASDAYFAMIRKILARQRTTTVELKPTCAPQFMPMAREMGAAAALFAGMPRGGLLLLHPPPGTGSRLPLPSRRGGRRAERAVRRDLGAERGLPEAAGLLLVRRTLRQVRTRRDLRRVQGPGLPRNGRLPRGGALVLPEVTRGRR